MILLLEILGGLVVLAVVLSVIGAIVGDMNLWTMAGLFMIYPIGVVLLLMALKGWFPGLSVHG